MQCTAPGLDLRLDRLSLSTEAPPVPVEGSGAVADLARRHITPEMTSAAIIQKMSHIPVGGGEGVITKRAAMCISPSVLAADFAHLADEVQRAEKAGANALHVDIMDGHFVRNLSMGQDVVAAINRSTNLPLHVHLMVEDPPRYINRFVQAGADALFFHVEATESIEKTLLSIRRHGIQAGLAINPETNTSSLQKFLPLLDAVLVMSVRPGFGGQSFLPETVERLKELRRYVDAEKRDPPRGPISIAVDGGITLETARLCVQAGATTLISGTHLFSAPDMEKAIADMRRLSV